MSGAPIATGIAISMAGAEVIRKPIARQRLYFAAFPSARRLDSIGNPTLETAFDRNMISICQWKQALKTPACAYPLVLASRTLLHQAAGVNENVVNSTEIGRASCRERV